MDELPKPPGHVELVDALLELATSASGILDDLTRANDVADRAAATDFLRLDQHVRRSDWVTAPCNRHHTRSMGLVSGGYFGR